MGRPWIRLVLLALLAAVPVPVPAAPGVGVWARFMGTSTTAPPAPVSVSVCDADAAWERVVLANRSAHAAAQRRALVLSRQRVWSVWSALRKEARLHMILVDHATNNTAVGCGCGIGEADGHRARLVSISRCQAALRAKARELDAALAGLPALPAATAAPTAADVSALLVLWEQADHCRRVERWLAANGFGPQRRAVRAVGAGGCGPAFVAGVARWWKQRAVSVPQLASIVDSARRAVAEIGCEALAEAVRQSG